MDCFAKLFLCLACSASFAAAAGEYKLVIARSPIAINGITSQAITVNGQVPGPTLRFREGEHVFVHVENRLEQASSVHWHGILLPGQMDGVPGLNGYQAIAPGAAYTYAFTVRQSGTYWYHSHSGSQEQAGLYGALVIEPAIPDPVHTARDYEIVLSDFTAEDPDEILRNLKIDPSYYNNGRRTAGDFFRDIARQGVSRTLTDRAEWGDMRMDPTDLADVSGYTFLTNGKSAEENWTGLFTPGERVRLRVINASAMSQFDVRIPSLRMIVIQADGQNIEPVPIDEFRIAPGETYDVIVTPKEAKAYTIIAEPLDRSGFARATLAPRHGMSGEIPALRRRTTLSMQDMGMHDHKSHQTQPAAGEAMDHTQHQMIQEEAKSDDAPKGWSDADTPTRNRVLKYADLRSFLARKDTRTEAREILVRLGGSMERYIWTINGHKADHADPIRLRFGERVKLTFINESMMAHPMHLHGMFVQLVNGQPADRLPNKHIVNVPPGKQYSVMLTADEPGEWAFHCHLLYHMMSGMMTKVVVAKLSAEKS